MVANPNLELDNGLARAKAAAKTTAELARHLGVSRSAVSQWRRVPSERVLDVERVTGVSRHVLRPDLYPIEIGEHRSSSPFPTEADA